MLSTIFILGVSVITASASDLADIRGSSAFGSWAVECASPTVTTSLLDERPTGENTSVRFLKTTAVCAASKTGLFTLDRGSVTLLSTCAEEPCKWDFGPSIEISSGAIAAIVISSDWGGYSEMDTTPVFERLIAVRQKESGGWSFSKIPNSRMDMAELPSDEFSDYRVEITSSGFVMTVKQHYVGDSEWRFLVENELKYLLTDGSIALLTYKFLSGSLVARIVDAFSSTDSERPWFRFTPGAQLKILGCRITSKNIRWEVTDGRRTAWINRIDWKNVPVPCER